MVLQNEYIKETNSIYSEINIKNDRINEYNNIIDNVIEKIEQLKNWDDYIEFNCNKYGSVCEVKNNIHIENNCGGNMIFTHEDTEYLFNDRPFCNYNDKEITYSNFKCSKCDYLYRKCKSSICGGSQYIPKGGFWWK